MRSAASSTLSCCASRRSTAPRAGQAGQRRRQLTLAGRDPGRLEDLLARGANPLDRIRMLFLDEADRTLDMGFRPAIDRILAACPQGLQTLFSPPLSTAKPDD
jgi:hypothetical protein